MKATRREIFWINTMAYAIGLISATGLVLLLIQSAYGDPNKPNRQGFTRGQRGFSNPVGNTRGAQAAPAAGQQPKSGQPQNTAPGGREIEIGGDRPGGVISHAEIDPILVDAISGEGSNQVVTDFNFPDADILDIAKTLGKLTGINFIFDKDVKGRITIISNTPITVGDAWKAFLTSLDINGFTLIPSGKYIRISRQRDARDKQIRAYTDDYSPQSDALVTRVFPLKYISADEVARTFRSFMPANSRIIPYAQTNTVIVTDTGSNIQKLEKMLDFLDVEGFDAGIEVIAVRNASAVDLAKLIDELIPGTPTKGRKSKRRFGRSGSFAARRTKEGGIINTIIADERTNTLIINANTKGVDQIRALITRLDRKLTGKPRGNIRVLYLQFADSEKVAQTINQLGSGSKSRTTSKGKGGVGSNPNKDAFFEGAIKVSADKEINALVITASPTDYEIIEGVVKKLDIPRDQVYVEVVIMELTLGRNFEYSANVISPKKGLGFSPNNDLQNFLLNPLSAGQGLVLGFKSNDTTKIQVGETEMEIPNLAALIKAIQTNFSGTILATPQILTLDNTEATFESSEKTPKPGAPVATQSGGVAPGGIDFQDVGLSIKIKPQINKVSEFVKLEIDAKLEDFSDRTVPSSVQGSAFATLERSAKTSVVVQDEDTVVLGGLIRDKSSETVRKVPILGDIPLLGWLFRATDMKVEKTNLLMFITPHIVRQYEKVRAILDKKLKQRDDFLEKNAGGEDLSREYRDEIIRSLPPREDLTNYNTPKSDEADYQE